MCIFILETKQIIRIDWQFCGGIHIVIVIIGIFDKSYYFYEVKTVLSKMYIRF